jgi:hypothetical protein
MTILESEWKPEFGKAAVSVPGTDQAQVSLASVSWSVPGTLAGNSGSHPDLSIAACWRGLKNWELYTDLTVTFYPKSV